MKALLFPLLAVGLFVACDDSSNAVVENPDAGGQTGTSSGQTTSGDAGPPTFDAGVDDAGNPKDCFDPPHTSHFQIINGCTNADKVVRTPNSTKIFADGGVPKP